MSKAQAARPAAEEATTARRPPRARSRAGPSNGPTTANGATVRASESATLDWASLTEMLKKMDPAKATATRASPADDRPCTRARRANAPSPAPPPPAGPGPAPAPPSAGGPAPASPRTEGYRARRQNRGQAAPAHHWLNACTG